MGIQKRLKRDGRREEIRWIWASHHSAFTLVLEDIKGTVPLDRLREIMVSFPISEL